MMVAGMIITSHDHDDSAMPGPLDHWQMADDDRHGDSGTMIMIRMTHRGSDHWHRMISCFGTRLRRESESDSESDIRVDYL